MESLQTFVADVHSQFGEDGIVSEILDRIAGSVELTRWSVEFGGADGVWLSNTCNLIRKRNYRGVFIEADPRLAAQLAANYPQPDVITLNRFIGLEGEDRLDAILASLSVPIDFDVLSIDIDGSDYWVLDSIETYRPRVIVIEFNPNIPNCVEFVQPRGLSLQQGSSPLSLKLLAESKGYELAATTFANLIFIRSDLRDVVLGAGSERLTLDQLRDDTETITHVFAAFDGTLILSGAQIRFPFHHVTVGAESLQVIPRFWRSYPLEWPKWGVRALSWRIFQRLKRRQSE